MLSFLSGYFEIVFLTILIILIHEMGHFLASVLLKLNVKEVRIYMFGGVTILDEKLNLNIFKELIMVISGPLIQVLFFILICILYKNGYVSVNTYNNIKMINILLLSFNLLPILPLDGAKILNNILDLIIPYEKSHKITIIISIIFLPLVLFFDNKIFLILQIIEEIKIHKYRLRKLLLERKLENIKFKKCKLIYKIKDVMRNKNFCIYVNNVKFTEFDYFNTSLYWQKVNKW